MGKFKVGDWVIGWHCKFMDRDTKPWQIGEIVLETNQGKLQEHVRPEGYPQHGTYSYNLVHAYGEEYPIF